LKVYERIVEKRVKEILNKQIEESLSGFKKRKVLPRSHIYIMLKQISGKIHEHDQKIYMYFKDILKLLIVFQENKFG